MMRSRYDDLHDRFEPILTGKAGTRYERLAALVWKALNQQDAVIHDMSMVGDSDVAHQIDITVEREGAPRRILIECKDYDVAQDKVGLGIVRDFRSVIEDTGADEGFIVTCVGFTRDAQKFAKAKGIKLILLRQVEEKDWDGRIRTIVLNIFAISRAWLEVKAIHMRPGPADLINAQMATAGIGALVTPFDRFFAVKGTKRKHVTEFLNERTMELSDKQSPGVHDVTILPDGWMFSIAEGEPIPFRGIEVKYEIRLDTLTRNITSDRIAELLVSGFGPHDLMIFDDQLKRLRINEEGEVEEAST